MIEKIVFSLIVFNLFFLVMSCVVILMSMKERIFCGYYLQKKRSKVESLSFAVFHAVLLWLVLKYLITLLHGVSFYVMGAYGGFLAANCLSNVVAFISKKEEGFVLCEVEETKKECYIEIAVDVLLLLLILLFVGPIIF